MKLNIITFLCLSILPCFVFAQIETQPDTAEIQTSIESNLLEEVKTKKSSKRRGMRFFFGSSVMATQLFDFTYGGMKNYENSLEGNLGQNHSLKTGTSFLPGARLDVGVGFSFSSSFGIDLGLSASHLRPHYSIRETYEDPTGQFDYIRDTIQINRLLTLDPQLMFRFDFRSWMGIRVGGGVLLPLQIHKVHAYDYREYANGELFQRINRTLSENQTILTEPDWYPFGKLELRFGGHKHLQLKLSLDAVYQLDVNNQKPISVSAGAGFSYVIGK